MGNLTAHWNVIGLASAQTIKKNGQIVDESTVPVAAENVNNELLTDISLFDFAENVESTENHERSLFAGCKSFPRDQLWPLEPVWKVFNLLTGGALIKTVPIGAGCNTNNEHYDADRCQEILDHWTESATHRCDPGGFPSYAVNISAVAQIQLAINFVRNTNVRLVVKNTGHDFLGKSADAGVLSIRTRNLKTIDFIEHYNGCGYSGPAMKLGAGVEVGELYAAADKCGASAVGGECKGVGVTGGYIQGSGHSPLSSIYGMGADQVLSIDIVLPSGRSITADKTNNSDIFWAVRGGGGATFGVVTSMTVKVPPKTVYSGLTFVVTSGNGSLANVTTEGHYGYSSVYPRFDGIAGYTWHFHPWLAPNTKLAGLKEAVASPLAEWLAVGFAVEPDFVEDDNFYTPWTLHFRDRSCRKRRPANRLAAYPSQELTGPGIAQPDDRGLGGGHATQRAFIMYNMAGKRQPGVDNAVNPAWHENLFYIIVGSAWTDDSTPAEIEAANKAITYDMLAKLRSISKGAGSYLNEGEIAEPNFQHEGWHITGQELWLLT
ncbi:putative 6-hydroxy-D-nicotine oxidase [Ustulina deusta]|nr:putative 6-hydroxy-D-nicotine oxidase [Ustulina deusta]